MNYSTSIFLINDAVRAVKVSYETAKTSEGKLIPAGGYTMFKTLDPDLAVGDFVTVPTDTRWEMTVCRVEAVDVEVDLESGAKVGWIIGRVDREAYEAILTQEGQAIEVIKSAEKRRKQDELRASLLKDNPDLAILADVGAGPALMAPPVPPAS